MGDKFKELWDQSPLGCIIGFILVLGLAFGILCAEAAIAMLLWNGCLAPAFAAGFIRQVGFWQTMGIMILMNGLFGTVSAIGKMWK